MSSLTQQTQQAPQQQAPQSEQAKQGPVPEAGAFGAGNAVDYQSGYGNSAVAGMAGKSAGQEGMGSEGGTLEQFDSELAADIANATTHGDAALQGTAGWGSLVPDSLAADADVAIYGLADLLSYLGATEAELRDAVAAGDEGAIHQLSAKAMDQLMRLEVATQLVEEYEVLYTGEGAELCAAILGVATLAQTLDEFEEIKARGTTAERARSEAQDAMKEAAQNIAEVALQGVLQASLMAAEDVAVTTVMSWGPGGMLLAIPIGAVMGAFSGVIDENLGKDPVEMLTSLTDLAGNVSGTVGQTITIMETLEKLPMAKTIGDRCSTFDKALLAVDIGSEVAGAVMDFVDAGLEFSTATQELEAAATDMEAFKNQTMPKVVDALGALPEMVEAARANAARSVGEIEILKAQYGDALYAE